MFTAQRDVWVVWCAERKANVLINSRFERIFNFFCNNLYVKYSYSYTERKREVIIQYK